MQRLFLLELPYFTGRGVHSRFDFLRDRDDEIGCATPCIWLGVGTQGCAPGAATWKSELRPYSAKIQIRNAWSIENDRAFTDIAMNLDVDDAPQRQEIIPKRARS